MTHKQKVKLARKLMSRRDLKIGRPMFLTNAWDAHREAIHSKVAFRQFNAGQRAIKRRELANV